MHIQNINTYQTKNFSPNFGVNLKSPKLNFKEDDFYVRTWSRPALAPSSVNGNYKLSNVLNVKFGNYNYGVNKEHSKWAISKNKSIVCFSDLNHTKSQKERGGNIVCFDDKRLHNIMKNAITKTD